ncbi:MAG TPA: divalent-cation tolerance protein CutA [Longimicrobiales bacterium]|nr:divalent-cation tolerance protein CutA [Longimicrobiales bacterium]
MAPDVFVVLVTAPPDEASALARTLVGEGRAACVNLLPSVTSVYRWKGKVQEDGETLLVFKTSRAALPDLVRRIEELHSYDVPECIAVPVTSGLPAYLDWVIHETR